MLEKDDVVGISILGLSCASAVKVREWKEVPRPRHGEGWIAGFSPPWAEYFEGV